VQEEECDRAIDGVVLERRAEEVELGSSTDEVLVAQRAQAIAQAHRRDGLRRGHEPQ
jgi:hypothetical protein